MGTSVRMIERAYGTLLDGAGASIAARLDAYDHETEEGQQERSNQGSTCTRAVSTWGPV
jgi:hypothetical protein